MFIIFDWNNPSFKEAIGEYKFPKNNEHQVFDRFQLIQFKSEHVNISIKLTLLIYLT
jgi:hypothetical protein